MKKSWSIISLLLGMTVATTLSAQTPSWQWVQSGGSIGSSSNSNYKEGCKSLGVDSKGNIYGFSNLASSDVYVDSIHYPSGFGYDDLAAFSYSCDGKLRWIKRIGCNMPDKPGDICVDNAGNSYVVGVSLVNAGSNAHFGDSSIIAPPTLTKSSFIISFDSLGNTNWLTLPGPENIVGLPTHYMTQVELDKDENPWAFVEFMGSCIYENYLIPDSGDYVFKYDKLSGNLQSLIRLDIKRFNGGPYSRFFTVDDENCIFMLCEVVDGLRIGNDTILLGNNFSNQLLIKFSSEGQLIWYKEVVAPSGINASYQMIWGKPAINDKYVYISGETRSYANSTFLGSPIVNNNASSDFIGTSVFARFDKYTGDFLSVNYIKNYNQIMSSEMFATNDKVYAACSGGLVNIMNENDTIYPYTYSITAYPFVVELDTALSYFNWGVATVASGVPEIFAISVDENNNIYVGGAINSTIIDGFGVTHTTHGNEDFFIGKISLDNNCECLFANPTGTMQSFQNNELTVSALFENQPDSAYWIWGDGDSSLYTNPGAIIQHNYLGNGPFDVSIRAWNHCGMSEDNLPGLIAIESIIPTTEVRIYPNPAGKEITIELNPFYIGGLINLQNIQGQTVLKLQVQNETQTISIENLTPGIYILEIGSKSGETYRERIVKY